MKILHSIWVVLLIMICSTAFVACGSDDEGEEQKSSTNSLIGGRWIQLESTREMVASWTELFPEWFESNECLMSEVSWKFLDNYSVVKFYTDIYACKRNDAFYSEKMGGHTIYFVEKSGDTYTYAIKDGLIYISNGAILNWGNGWLLDNGVTWVKK